MEPVHDEEREVLREHDEERDGVVEVEVGQKVEGVRGQVRESRERAAPRPREERPVRGPLRCTPVRDSRTRWARRLPSRGGARNGEERSRERPWLERPGLRGVRATGLEAVDAARGDVVEEGRGARRGEVESVEEEHGGDVEVVREIEGLEEVRPPGAETPPGPLRVVAGPAGRAGWGFLGAWAGSE